VRDEKVNVLTVVANENYEVSVARVTFAQPQKTAPPAMTLPGGIDVSKM
jgi:hypothetical protein